MELRLIGKTDKGAFTYDFSPVNGRLRSIVNAFYQTPGLKNIDVVIWLKQSC